MTDQQTPKRPRRRFRMLAILQHHLARHVDLMIVLIAGAAIVTAAVWTPELIGTEQTDASPGAATTTPVRAENLPLPALD